MNYCRYSYPNQLIRDIGMQDNIIDCAQSHFRTKSCDLNVYASQKLMFTKAIVILIVFIFLFRALAYYIMRYRLKN